MDGNKARVAHEILSLEFDYPEIPMNFSSALLGGLLYVLQNCQKNIALGICSASDVSSRILVWKRHSYENDLLDLQFPLFEAVVAATNKNERVARIKYKKVAD